MVVSRVRIAVLLVAVSSFAAVPPAAFAAEDAPRATFAQRLEAALASGPVAWDRLWARDARTGERRVLDARAHALFDWADVRVMEERRADLGGGRIETDVTVRGTATWRPNAWGVASSFWTQQTDERRESNRVVRRERWIGDADGGMTSRELLGLLDVTQARVAVGAYPGQDALLVDCTYDVRALADGVQAVRFLLDRRVQVYDFRVDGELCDVVRGNELGSLGLEGFSPEVESSLLLPRALREGDEAVLRFRLRSPLVHMGGDGYLTTLPLRDGAFRERVWLPVLDPAGADDVEEEIRVSISWPEHAFSTVALAAGEEDRIASAPVEEKLEESRLELTTRGDVAGLDFVLLSEGVTFADLPGDARAAVGDVATFAGRADVLRFSRTPPGATARGRRALIDPMIDVSQSSSRDLSSELQDLIPMDDDVMDELFDDGAQDAERGADDRQAG